MELKYPKYSGKESIEKKYRLSSETCDRTADLIMEFCGKERVSGKDSLRYRLSAEECLLYWMDNGCEGNSMTIRMGRQLFRPYIILEMEGSEQNPYKAEDWEDPYYYNNILANLNLEPAYSYVSGKNRLFFRLKRKSPGQLTILGLIILASLLVGMLGQVFLAENIRQSLVSNLMDPLYQAFFSMLGCVAGPMVFLSVVWGILGIGDISTFGKIGRKMMLTFFRLDFLTVVAGVVFLPVFGISLYGTAGSGSRPGEILKMLLGIFPANVLDPFLTNNTLQIVFLAVVAGITLLYLGRQTNHIARLVGEFNSLVQYIMGWVSSLVPYVIFLILPNLIWSGKLSSMGAIWKLVLAFLAGECALVLFFLLRTAIRQKTRVSTLMKKSLPAVLIAFTSASSTAAFAPSQQICGKEYGIAPAVTGFGLPLSMVMLRPALSLYYLLMSFFMAGFYRMECSPGWVVMAVLVCTIVGIASPPVPGGAAAAASMIFTQLNIPMEAMAIALTVNILIDFAVTAIDTLGRHMTLFNLASDLNMLDKG